MRTPRIYITEKIVEGQPIAVEPGVSHHLARVLRVREKDHVVLFDGSGIYFEAEVIEVRADTVRILPLQQGISKPVSGLQITLVQGISRGQKMDFTIQKAVELGVHRIIPVVTDFSNVKLIDERVDKKLAHWKKIVISACEQSSRYTVPDINFPESLDEWLAGASNQLKLMFVPEADHTLADIQSGEHDIVILCGPEGGFSERERQLALSHSFQTVRLGPRILRTETAGIAAIAACQTLWGDFL